MNEYNVNVTTTIPDELREDISLIKEIIHRVLKAKLFTQMEDVARFMEARIPAAYAMCTDIPTSASVEFSSPFDVSVIITR